MVEQITGAVIGALVTLAFREFTTGRALVRLETRMEEVLRRLNLLDGKGVVL